jgi:hypothetical protein
VSTVSTARRIPRGLPFVVRHSPTKFALLFIILTGIVEIGLWFQTAPDERADMFGTIWVHGFVVGIFFLAWLVCVVRGPTFALDDGGVWVALRGWPRRLVLRVPWEHVARVVEARHQWHSVIGVVLRDPSHLRREALGRKIDRIVGMARQHYGADLAASLTLANTSSAAVARALRRWAPPDVDWHMSADADDAADTALGWASRITVTVGWVVLFLFAIPWALLAAIGSGFNSLPGLLIAFTSATIGTATLPKALNAYERFVHRGQRSVR